MKKITIDQIHGWGACNRGPHQKYGKPALVKLFGGNSITPLALSRLRIPIADRFWVLLHEGVLSRKNLRLFMADCAEHVLHIFEKRRPKDDRPRKAIQGARDFAEDRINFKELIALPSPPAAAEAAEAVSAYAAAAAADASSSAAAASFALFCFVRYH